MQSLIIFKKREKYQFSTKIPKELSTYFVKFMQEMKEKYCCMDDVIFIFKNIINTTVLDLLFTFSLCIQLFRRQGIFHISVLPRIYFESQ